MTACPPRDHRVFIQGVGVDPLDVGGLLGWVEAFIDQETCATISYLNVHVCNLAARNPQLHRFLVTSTLCYCDGIGVALGLRALGHAIPGRMTGADWIHDLCARAASNGWRIAWIGSQPGVTARAARVLRQRHKGLNIVWTDHGYRTHAEDVDRQITALNQSKPDILLVGMGTPTQEAWVDAHREAIEAPVVWCLGATADIISGHRRRGPRQLHQNQEWVARLLMEPRLMWKRYLIGNPRFVLRVLRERLRGGLH